MKLKYTTETFNQELIRRGYNDVKLVGEYKGYAEKGEFECLKCGNKWTTGVRNVLQGKRCRKCAVKEFGLKRRKSNEYFLKDFTKKGNPNIEVLGKYIGVKHKILTRCKKNPNHVWDAWPEVLLRGSGCPFCNNKRISPKKENSVGAVCPELLKYFKNKKDAYNYTPYSNKKVPMVCPICGREKNNLIGINDLVSNGFSCDFCSDKVSRPNKFLRLLLFYLEKQGLIKSFNLEYKPNWCKKYPYDGFIITLEGENLLVEMQGIQHYTKENSLYSKGVKKRDKEKLLLAQENKTPIVYIDCSNTTFSNMKNKILDSEIGQKIDLTKVNWGLIEKQVEKNQVKELCDFYNNNPQLSLTEISRIKKLGYSTVERRLKRGAELGWCIFSKEKSKINCYFKKLKPVIVTYSDGKTEKFVSVKEAIKILGFNSDKFHDILKKGGSYKDYNICYATEEEAKEIKEKWIIEQKSKIKNS